MAWYQIPGPGQDVAVFTEISCARNVATLPFPARLDATRARTLISRAAAVLEPNGFHDAGLSDLPRAAAYSLAERHYITPATIILSRPHALFLNEPCGLSVTIGGEDHFTITALRAGLALSDAQAAVASVEKLGDTACPLAFDERLGYLTCDPARVGTGLRLRVTLCLPLLEETGRMHTISRRLSEHGVDLLPLPPKSNRHTTPYATSFPPSVGYLYRLTMTKTLGMTEEDVLERMTVSASYLIDAERHMRTSLSAIARERIQDRVLRSQAILQVATHLDSEEAIWRMSDLRLGAALGFLPDVKVESLTAALMETMPAGIEAIEEKAPVSVATPPALKKDLPLTPTKAEATHPAKSLSRESRRPKLLREKIFPIKA